MTVLNGHTEVLTHDQGESGGLLSCGDSELEPQVSSCSSMAGPSGAGQLLTTTSKRWEENAGGG